MKLNLLIFYCSYVDLSLSYIFGIDYTEEFAAIMEIYNRYPVKELTIHPRPLKEQYKGVPHYDIFLEALHIAKMPVCYNGDINTVEDYVKLMKLIGEDSDKNVSVVMIGRGLLRDPALIWKISAYNENKSAYLEVESGQRYEASNEEVRAMLCRLQKDYAAIYSGQTPVLYKLKEIWCYLDQEIYADKPKLLKKIMKSKSLVEYESYVEQMLSDK